MPSLHRLTCLITIVLFVHATAGLAQTAGGESIGAPVPTTSVQELPYGHSRTDGRVAIDPLLVYLDCREISTLIIAPERVAEVQSQFGASVGGDGSWILPTGEVLTPQIGELAIQTATNEEDLALSSLTPLPVQSVVMATAAANVVCVKKIKKHKCFDFKCDGCENRADGGSVRYATAENGKTFTYCKRSDNPADECTQTGGFKTCTETRYANADCQVPDLTTSVVNYYSCELKKN